MLEVKFKQQIAQELSMSLSTLKRRITAYQLDIPRGLVCPRKQKEIYYKLGYEDLWEQRYGKLTSNEPKRA